MPLYISADTVKPPTPSVRTFYSDDSACEIQGKRHTIIGAIEFHDDKQALSSMLRCKQQLGIPLVEEIKWNSQKFTRAQREKMTDNLLPVLGNTSGFLCIVEGRDKQLGAVKLMKQLSEYCRTENSDAFTVVFDKSIVQDIKTFDLAIESLMPGCMGWSKKSIPGHNPLVQLADLFCGFQKLRIDFGSGQANGKKLVNVEFYEGEIAEYELRHYLFAGLRYSLWGKVRGTWDSSHSFIHDPL